MTDEDRNKAQSVDTRREHIINALIANYERIQDSLILTATGVRVVKE